MNLTVLSAPVAQLDRVSDSDSEGHAFESHRAYQEKVLDFQGLFPFVGDFEIGTFLVFWGRFVTPVSQGRAEKPLFFNGFRYFWCHINVNGGQFSHVILDDMSIAAGGLRVSVPKHGHERDCICVCFCHRGVGMPQTMKRSTVHVNLLGYP